MTSRLQRAAMGCKSSAVLTVASRCQQFVTGINLKWAAPFMSWVASFVFATLTQHRLSAAHQGERHRALKDLKIRQCTSRCAARP